MRIFIFAFTFIVIGGLLVLGYLNEEPPMKNDDIIVIKPFNTEEFHKKVEDVVINELKESISSISDSFEYQLRYPDYSTLLTAEDLALSKSDFSSSISRPYDFSGLTGNVTLFVNKFSYRQGEAIEGSVKISGDDGFMDLIKHVSVSVDKPYQHKETSRSPLFFDRYSDAAMNFSLNVPDVAGEYIVATIIEMHGQDNILQSSVVEVEGLPIAQLTQVENGYIENNDLYIPYFLNKEKEGFYRISANLLSNDGKPIASLQESFFSEDVTQTHFRVSGLLLHDLKANPPYKLRDINIEHIPEEASEKVGKGISTQSEFVISPAITYEDFEMKKTVVSVENQQRLEFLKSIAN